MCYSRSSFKFSIIFWVVFILASFALQYVNHEYMKRQEIEYNKNKKGIE